MHLPNSEIDLEYNNMKLFIMTMKPHATHITGYAAR